jgi:putative transposase
MPAHIVQRGNNRQPCFFDDNDYTPYLERWRENADKADNQIHAYVLMTKRVHLLVTPARAQDIGEMLQSIGRRYVQYVNHACGRTGTLWEGAQGKRDRCGCLPALVLRVHRAESGAGGHGDFTSRLRVVQLPRQWGGADDKAITPHPLCLALGDSAEARREAYRELFHAHLDPDAVQRISAATETGTPSGNGRFREQIESALKRKVGYAKRGRPSKITDDSQPSGEEMPDLFG